MKIALAQMNSIVGNIDANVTKILNWAKTAEEAGCDIIVFPELAVCGYPPEDLILRESFLDAIHEANLTIGKNSGRCVIVFGTIKLDSQNKPYNTVSFASNGSINMNYFKYHLPNDHVFDEARYFKPAKVTSSVHQIDGIRVCGMVCEDIWHDNGPVSNKSSVEIVFVVNASPYHEGKQLEREQIAGKRAQEMNATIVYVNMVGGQDELVFDGGSFVVNPQGKVIARCIQFEEALNIIDLDNPKGCHPRIVNPYEEIFNALSLGLGDYVAKSGFEEVVIGISGGIDSAVVASIASLTLGAHRVHGVMMPSRYSSDSSLLDGESLISNLGIKEHILDINVAHHAVDKGLKDFFDGTPPGVAEENVQARLRGLYLMALSNKFGWLVLTTGNKSEMAVGYSTLYGDMAGGFNPLKDVYKTDVWRLARWMNERYDPEGLDLWIPRTIIDKPPSAELRPDQTDQDSLPDYPVLDTILHHYVDLERPVRTIYDLYPEEVVNHIVRLVDTNEYKRRQAPPGPRISEKAFGKDRRLPIINHFRG